MLTLTSQAAVDASGRTGKTAVAMISVATPIEASMGSGKAEAKGSDMRKWPRPITHPDLAHLGVDAMCTWRKSGAGMHSPTSCRLQTKTMPNLSNHQTKYKSPPSALAQARTFSQIQGQDGSHSRVHGSTPTHSPASPNAPSSPSLPSDPMGF